MGGRSEGMVLNDLIGAGCELTLAQKLSKGARLTGHAADQFVSANKFALAINDVTVLRNLFAQLYPHYVAAAKSNYDYHSATFRHAMAGYGKKYADAIWFSWEELYPSIRVIAIDFTYQGFGRQKSGYGKPLHFCMANNFEWLIDYITHTPGLNKYEKGRHRAEYLRKNQAFEEQFYSQCTAT
jgi:type VI secretion system secreted protein VgrG